jgi:hypothetical protein
MFKLWKKEKYFVRDFVIAFLFQCCGGDWIMKQNKYRSSWDSRQRFGV